MSANLPEHDIDRQVAAARDLVAMIGDQNDADETLINDMIEGETGLIEALDRAVSAIRDSGVIEHGCKAEIDILDARRRRAQRRQETLRTAIEQAMVSVGIDSITLPTKTLSIVHRDGKAVITEEAEIPAEFWTPQPPKLDKAALNAALKERSVPGAHLSNGTVSLMIRSK